jgi:1-acyl-sn-glycerol-3-phosphate acyltransferase
VGIDRLSHWNEVWTHTPAARVAREVLMRAAFGPIVDGYTHRRVVGLEHLRDVDAPAIFVANHASHLDTPALLCSLPGRWRRRTGVAAAADYFYTGRLLAATVSLSFGTVPVERSGRSLASDAAARIERLIDRGWSLLVFAEGTRSRDGRVGRLHTGAAALAAQHARPLVPIHLAGSHAVMPVGRPWPVRPAGGGRFARHPLVVSFGAPIRADPREDRYEVMERVRLFMERCGAETTPDPKLAARRRAAARRAER